MNRLLHNDSVERRGRKGKKPALRQEVADVLDDIEDVFFDIDTILEKHASHHSRSNEIRRKIERLREEQLLHQELGDSYYS
jgi:hypothetical protein